MKQLIARIISKQPATDQKKIDAAYVLGASAERLRILHNVNVLLESYVDMDYVTAPLRQFRDSLENHHKSNGG